MGKSDVRARLEGVELPPYVQIVPPRRAHEARAAIGGGTLLMLSPGRAFGERSRDSAADRSLRQRREVCAMNVTTAPDGEERRTAEMGERAHRYCPSTGASQSGSGNGEVVMSWDHS